MEFADGVSSQVKDSAEFEKLLERNLSFSQNECERLAKQYGLPNELAGDIYVEGMMRIQKLFRKDAKTPYKFLSENQDHGLLRKNFKWAASDVRHREQKDQLLVNAISLDATSYGDDEQNSSTLGDKISTEETTYQNGELEEAIEEICREVTNPGWLLVLDYLLGKVDADELLRAGYDDNYIRVTKNRIKKRFGARLAPFWSMSHLSKVDDGSLPFLQSDFDNERARRTKSHEQSDREEKL